MSPERSLEPVAIADASSELRAEFVPGAGMLCSRLAWGAVNLIAENEGVAEYAARGKTMGIPLLYPWANRLADREYTIGALTARLPDDQSVIAVDGNGLPIHGVVPALMRWAVIDAGASRVRARLAWDAALGSAFDCFPFAHTVDYEAALADRCLTIGVSVTAGDDRVPVSFGFHPYLAPGGPRARYAVSLPAMRHLELDARSLPTGAGAAQDAANFELAGSTFDDGYDGLAPGARFEVAGERRRVTLTFAEGYPCAQVYAPQGRDFICFEPMSTHTNALALGAAPLLAAGESWSAKFALAVDEV